MERREFIKRSCVLCAGAAGLGLLASELTSCTPIAVVRTPLDKKTAKVSLDAFKEQSMVIVRDNQVEFDLLAVKKTDGTYSVVQMKCTHEAQPLTANKTGLYCASHGSSFDLDGKVTKEPAIKNLNKYLNTIENQELIIHLDQLVS